MTEQTSDVEEGATISTGTVDDKNFLLVPSAADADASEPVEEVGAQQVLKNLLILPPKQKEGTFTPGDVDELQDAIPLPPIRAEEPVSSIKAALGEICGYAHLTNYRLVLEDVPQQSRKRNGKYEKSLPIGPSPYTGCNAVVSVPVAVKSLNDDGLERGSDKSQADPSVLDDYGDLCLLLQSGGLHDGSGFRIVLERYDAALVRDHVVRLRSLFDGNAPSSISLDDGAVPDKSTKEGGGDEDPEVSPEDPAATDGNADTAPQGKGSAGNETSSLPEPKGPGAPASSQEGKEKDPKEATKGRPKDIPVYPHNQPLSPNTKDLKHFFYYACGEEPALYADDGNDIVALDGSNNLGSKSKKKNKKKNTVKNNQSGENDEEGNTAEQLVKELLPQLNALEERTRVQCFIRFSGFHPPPQFRRLMGDLAYLEVTLPGGGETVHITATPMGFFVNRSSSINGAYKSDPRPAPKSCFSHELLDCLLQYSSSVVDAWTEAQTASKLRSKLMAKVNQDGPFSSFFRVAIRGDFSGYMQPSVAVASEGIDALIQNPSWLVPVTKIELEAKESWTRNCAHTFNPAKTEEDLSSSFGVDMRGGALRDWNEELQVAREMPVESLLERIERARLVLLLLFRSIFVDSTLALILARPKLSFSLT
jgi:protein TIF31